MPLVEVYFGHACLQGSKCTSAVKCVVHSVLVCKWDSIIWLEVAAVVLTWNSHFPGALKHVYLSYRLTGGHFGSYIHFSKTLGSHRERFILGYTPKYTVYTVSGELILVKQTSILFEFLIIFNYLLLSNYSTVSWRIRGALLATVSKLYLT